MPVCEISARKVGRAVGRWVGEREVEARAQVGAVRQLKAETNGEIEVSGAALAASLVRFGLVDEFRLYMMPVVLGGGKPYFEAGLQLELEPLGAERRCPSTARCLLFRPKKS